MIYEVGTTDKKTNNLKSNQSIQSFICSLAQN